MKKITSLIIAAAFVIVAPGFAHAQQVTSQDIDNLSPQLMSVFSSMSSTLTGLQNKKFAQNTLMTEYSLLLGSMSARLNSSLTPTDIEINDMANQVAEIQTQLGAISAWRASVRTAVGTISGILSQIGNIISSAA